LDLACAARLTLAPKPCEMEFGDYFQSSTYSSKFSSTKEHFKSNDFQEDVKKGRGALRQAPYVS